MDMTKAVLTSCGLNFGEDDNKPNLTKVAVFAPADAAVRLAAAIHENAETLTPWLSVEREAARKRQADKQAKSTRRSRGAKRPAGDTATEPAATSTEATAEEGTAEKNPLPARVRNRIIAALAPADAIDIALFGRMLAEIAEAPNVDGAVQSSHAFTVDASATVEDFFTAVDDEKDHRRKYALDAIDDSFGDDSGAAITGYQSLTSGTFYRSTVLDRDQLRRNLRNGDMPEESIEAAATAAELAFTEAFCQAVPPAKKTSTGAPGVLPKLVLAVCGARPVNYAAAFEQALVAEHGNPVSTQAARRLLRQHQLVASRLPGLSRGALLSYDVDIVDMLAELRASGASDAVEVTSVAELVHGGAHEDTRA